MTTAQGSSHNEDTDKNQTESPAGQCVINHFSDVFLMNVFPPTFPVCIESPGACCSPVYVFLSRACSRQKLKKTISVMFIYSQQTVIFRYNDYIIIMQFKKWLLENIIHLSSKKNKTTGEQKTLSCKSLS